MTLIFLSFALLAIVIKSTLKCIRWMQEDPMSGVGLLMDSVEIGYSIKGMRSKEPNLPL